MGIIPGRADKSISGIIRHRQPYEILLWSWSVHRQPPTANPKGLEVTTGGFNPKSAMDLPCQRQIDRRFRMNSRGIEQGDIRMLLLDEHDDLGATFYNTFGTLLLHLRHDAQIFFP